MTQINFKATRNVSRSCDGYRQIRKNGDVVKDMCADSDDVINIDVEAITGGRIIIDCDKKTGWFSIKF